jgi:hypothetical protein
MRKLMVVFALMVGAGTVDAGCTLNTLASVPSGYAASSASYEVTAGACLSCAPAPAALALPPVNLSAYCAPTAGVFASPSYYAAGFQTVGYRTNLSSYPIQRTFPVSYGSQTRFLGPPVYASSARVHFPTGRGSFPVPVPVPVPGVRGGGFGGGGGPISNIIRAIGDVANSPAGTFALGAFVGNGFRFGGPRTNTVVVPGGNISAQQAALFNASQRRR